MDFKGKNVIVTGGCGQIGKEFAIELLRKGVQKVGLFDIVDPRNATEELKKQFPDRLVKYYKTDVANKANIVDSFDAFRKEMGQIDIVVLSAGIVNEFDFEKVTNVNLIGSMNTILIALDHMSISKNGSGGLITSIASTTCFSFQPFFPCFTASKHGFLAFTKAMANDINTKKHGVRFVIICPGGTDTELSNLNNFKKFYLPDFLPLAEKTISGLSLQKPEIVAKLAMDPMVSGENGSVWIINNSKIQEYVHPILDL